MNISSQAFRDRQLIPSKYACDGSNASPPLLITGAPGGTVSFALIIDDPDAPSGTFTHWILYNIPSAITSIPENGTPPGSMQGINSAGHDRYDGPCPPAGTHRYFFRLYALDSMMDLNPGTSRQILQGSMRGHILDRAELVGLYHKIGISSDPKK